MAISDMLTPEEVASILRISSHAVIKKLGDREGVVDLGWPGTKFRRRYRVLRIPRELVEQYIDETRVRRTENCPQGAGPSVVAG